MVMMSPSHQCSRTNDFATSGCCHSRGDHREAHPCRPASHDKRIARGALKAAKAWCTPSPRPAPACRRGAPPWRSQSRRASDRDVGVAVCAPAQARVMREDVADKGGMRILLIGMRHYCDLRRGVDGRMTLVAGSIFATASRPFFK